MLPLAFGNKSIVMDYFYKIETKWSIFYCCLKKINIFFIFSHFGTERNFRIVCAKVFSDKHNRDVMIKFAKNG